MITHNNNYPILIVLALTNSYFGTSMFKGAGPFLILVVPTITGRDFVIATLAAPTVMKEPEKPAEAEATEGEAGAEVAADGEKPAAEGEDKKAVEEKK